MGLGLSTIKDVLNEYKDNESLSSYLSIQATHKREEIDLLQRQLTQLETTITALRKNESILRYSIEVKQIPARIIASIRNTISSYEQEGDLWPIIADTLKQQKIPLASLAYDMAIYHNEGFVESGIDIELQKTVAKRGRDTERVRFKEAPAMLAAVLTYEGEYQQILEIGGLIANWVKDNHYTFNGSHFNIYHVSPKTESDVRKMVTEVGYPIRKIESL